MNISDFKLKVLGSRGSMSVDGTHYSEFGGSTSCYLVTAGDETVFLDAGSGIVNAPVDFPKTPVILLSHLHLDHILGLGMYQRLSMAGVKTRLCIPAENAEAAEAAIDGVYSPPYWPVSFRQYAGEIQIEPLVFPLRLGELLIDGIEGSHPGGCKVIRLRYRGRSLVYVTDYEHESSSFEALKSFAENADLILYDGQYESDEYERKRGFGHSTPEMGMKLLEAVHAKLMLLVHHDPQSTDEELSRREKKIPRSGIRYARQGETVDLQSL